MTSLRQGIVTMFGSDKILKYPGVLSCLSCLKDFKGAIMNFFFIAFSLGLQDQFFQCISNMQSETKS